MSFAYWGGDGEAGLFFFLMNLSILCGIIHIPINLLLKCLIQCFLFELPR